MARITPEHMVEAVDRWQDMLDARPVDVAAHEELKADIAAGRSLRDALLKREAEATDEEFGHTDFRFTFSIYQKAGKRREKLSGRYREAYDAALVWAQIGAESKSDTPDPLSALLSQDQENAS